MLAQDHPKGSRTMRADVVKVLLIAATVSVLSACSGAGGLTTTSCFSADCQSPEGRSCHDPEVWRQQHWQQLESVQLRDVA
jgi:hypothetical protein